MSTDETQPAASEPTPDETPSATPTEEAPAEAKKTDARQQEQRVPLARLNKVIQERNQLRERLEQLEAAQPKVDDEPDADEQLERARRLIEENARAMLERELGMPLAKVKSALASTETSAADVAQRQWERLCAARGLDPDNEDLQAYVTGKARSGEDVEKALERAKGIFAAAKPRANVETDGVSPSMTKTDAVFWDKKSAQEAASKGIKARHVDTGEIVERLAKQLQEGAKR